MLYLAASGGYTMSFLFLCLPITVFLCYSVSAQNEVGNGAIKMNNLLSPDTVSSIVQKCNARGLRDVCVNNTGTPAAGGYVGKLVRIGITYNSSSTDERNRCAIKAILKTASRDLRTRQHVPITQMSAREILFYDHISPLLYGTVLSNPLARARVPISYCTSDEYLKEYIIMEDLKSASFELMKEANLDYAHAALAVQALARFHGQTILLREKDPQNFSTIAKQLTDNFMTSAGEFDASGIKRYGQLSFEKFINAVANQDVRDKLGVIGRNFSDKFQELFGGGNFKVISHGDYWINNIMFKYEGRAPKEAAILDFQMLRHSSIANDFLAFIGTCFEVELRRNHFHQLLIDYYEQLRRTIRAGGQDLERICTWDQLKQELKDQAFFGIAMASMNIQFFDDEPIEDLTILYSGTLPKKFFNISATYRKFVNELVDDFISWKLL